MATMGCRAGVVQARNCEERDVSRCLGTQSVSLSSTCQTTSVGNWIMTSGLLEEQHPLRDVLSCV